MKMIRIALDIIQFISNSPNPPKLFFDIVALVSSSLLNPEGIELSTFDRLFFSNFFFFFLVPQSKGLRPS